MSKRILIVDKTAVIKESMIKSFDALDLYKKAGFKTAEGFELAHQWTLSDGAVVSLYGKTSGKVGQENKYDFPPPVDKVLFFGSCILVSDKTALKKTEWEAYYEELFGGFEDIGEEDSEVSEDDDESEGLPRTKAGYVKDGFVVDDGDEDADEDDDEDDDEDADEADEDVDESEEIVVAIKKQKQKRAGSKRKGPPTVFEKIDTSSDDNFFLDCTSELQEEEYE
jgi:hypothetical protein